MKVCIACGRVGNRGFQKIGGFHLDNLGDWWEYRGLFFPTVFICSARLACMRRIYGSGYSRAAFNELPEPRLAWAEESA